MLSEVGGRPAYPGAAAEYYERNGAYPSVEINQIVAGEPRTVVPAVARATLSIRLAPGQRADEIGPVADGILRDAAPADADVTIAWQLADPSLFEPDLPALVLAAQALERATGVAPALIRSGGSIPVVAEFAAREIPTIVSGFTLPDDAFHAPDESFLVANLELGERAGRELLTALAAL